MTDMLPDHAPLWFLRLRHTTGEWGKWTETDAATVEDFRRNVTLPIYEARLFVPADGGHDDRG